MKRGFGLLAVFIVLRGSDSTVLKLLQNAGSAVKASGGAEVISFCNVFFFSSLVSGLVLLINDRVEVARQLQLLTIASRWLLFAQSFSGFFLGPMCFYLALERLSVIEQTLLFSLTVPLSALMARQLLKERLPPSFRLNCALITAGLLLAQQPLLPGRLATSLDPRGLLWALLGVVAFALSAVLNRVAASRGLTPGLTVGLNSLAAAVAFAVIALTLFGPQHFFYLSFWWVLGVIGGYALLITLASQWCLMQSYLRLPVAQVSLWSSITIVVALVEAHLVLAEGLSWQAVLGAAMILFAVGLRPWAAAGLLRVQYSKLLDRQ